MDINDLIEGLSKTLRIQPERFICLTDPNEVQDRVNNYDPDLMIFPVIYYEVIIKPNSTYDNPEPSYYSELML